MEPLAVISNQCVCPTSASNANTGGAQFLGVVLPNDQYAEMVVTACTGNGFCGVGVRSDITSFLGYEISIGGPLGASVQVELANTGPDAGQLDLIGTFAVNIGDTIGVSAIGSTITAYVNRVAVLSGIDTQWISGTSFIEMVDATSVNNTKIASFACGRASLSNAYSVPDARNFGTFPNSFRTVQGTQIFDVPSSYSLRCWFDTAFNPTQPLPIDSRVAGVTDSRVASIIPQNSRTPGTYGPGE